MGTEANKKRIPHTSAETAGRHRRTAAQALARTAGSPLACDHGGTRGEGEAVTQWGGPGYDGDPVDPNPGNPVPPPVFYVPAPQTVRYPGYDYPAPPYAWSGYLPPPGT